MKMTPIIFKEKMAMACLFFDIEHSFSLPASTKNGVEIFNPQKNLPKQKSLSSIYKNPNLGLRCNSLTDDEFLQIRAAFSDGIHFITGHSMNNYSLIFSSERIWDYKSDMHGWSWCPGAFQPADGEALSLCLERLPVLIPFQLQ
jgi:hypothetical protein